MTTYYLLVRALHMIAGSSWLGTVVLINFVLIPLLPRLPVENRKILFSLLFPAIFRLASVLSATVVITGVYLVHHLTDGDWDFFDRGKWGSSIFWGGLLGTALTIFHFFIESYLGKKIEQKASTKDATFEDIHLKIKIIPRLGLLVLLLSFLLMINATHGL